MAQLLLRTLGPLVLLNANGVAVSATRRKELALLAYLARRGGRLIRRAELLDLLWGDRPEENARLSLRQALLRLRRLVGDTLEVSPETVTLAAEAVALDIGELERDVAERRFADAVARWEGEFLSAAEDAGGERYRAWVHAERAALRKLLVVAFEHLIAEASARGAWADVVALADRWSAADPDDERAHVALVDALLLRGRATDALARHAAFIAKLESAASREITRLGERLDRAARTAAPPSPGSAGIFSPDLVGREKPHAEIVAAWRRARDGEATAIVVEGEAGIGKTRLADEFLRGLRAERRAHVLLRARGHGGDAPALTVARELLAPLERAPGLAGAAPERLAALALLVPAIRDRFPTLPDVSGHASPDAVAGVIADVASEAPVVILVDDIAATDAASRALLLGVATRLRDAAVLFLVTARPGDVGADELRDATARRLHLAPLAADDLDALLASMLQMDDEERRALAARLYRERGGNPFDVNETVVMLVDDGLLAPDGGGTWRLSPALAERPLPVPGTVREAMQRRVSRLSPEARRVLSAAASLEDGFTLTQLARVTRAPEPVVADALDQLVARRLIRLRGAGGGFEVAHHAVHLAAVESLHAPRRARPWRYGWLAAAAAALIAMTLFVSRQHPVFARSEAPLVAIAGAWETSGDSADAWLADGLPRLIESRLTRASGIAVLPAARVEAVRQRARLPHNAPIAADAAVDLGRRLGVTWVVRAAVTQADTGLLIALSVHSVEDGTLVRHAVVRGTDLFAAADAAVAQILSLAGVGRDGPRLAELETSSTAAFEQYIRAARASADGRASAEIAALDAAIALDSSFGSALLLRAGIAREQGDSALLRRLTTRLERVRPRLSARDRLHWDASQALHAGDRTRAERLARELVVRFPRDPRGHDMLADLYFVTGRWREMEQLLRETLALDSLGMSAGDGPCVPCVTYGRLVEVQWRRGDREGAERSARRWVEVQPASANAHHHLAKVLARLRRGAEAERHMLRAVSLAGGDPGQQVSLARVYLMTGNLDAVDSLLRAWDASGSPAFDAARPDIRSLLALERGDLRPGVIALQRALAADPRMRWLELVLGTLHGRMGDYRSATTLLESHGHIEPGPVQLPLDAAAARNFAWSHALLADAIAPSGDTVRLRALADSIALVAPSSYFGRDWTLHHHVRGLIAMHGRRYAEAEREFQQARWGAAGWTRTVVELAKAQLAQGRARDAMVTLRDAYEWPDAMGRYQAVRETDSLMVEARGRVR